MFGGRLGGLSFVIIAPCLVIHAERMVSATDIGAEASKSCWILLNEMPLSRGAEAAWVRPERFQGVSLDLGAMRDVLGIAPLEVNREARRSELVVTLPLPDGSFQRFRIVESPIMAPELAAKFPEIHTYLGQGIDDPTAVARLDVTPKGFHAQMLSSHGAAYIDPYTRGDTATYTCYYKHDLAKPDFACLGPEGIAAVVSATPRAGPAALVTGSTRREYRLACAADGEYTAYHSLPDPPNVAAGMAAIVTAINRVTGVYETEVAVRLILVANDDLLVYTDANTDPYTNNDGATMLGQNQTTVNAVIGSANYDIGHVFSTGGGGIASLNSVCNAGSKAQGVTGLSAPIGDGFYIDFVAHEMGHQFNANHTFNGSSSNCGSNRHASTAYEPGAGSTIMSYAGVCGVNDNYQNHSDAYFHLISLQEISNYITSGTGSNCPTQVATGNNPPTVDAGPNYTIPSGTPFILTAAAGSDPDGDAVTYCWEERDLGPAQGAGQPDNGSSPIIRTRTGTVDPSRMVPILSSVLINAYSLKGEKLPTTTRTLNFRCTVRDNRAGAGGSSFDDMAISVTNAGGAFSVTAPNTAVSWSGAATVTWNVAGTNGPPVNTANVNILLSTDGGNSFPIILAAGTANDGSENVTLPNIGTATARIKIEAVGNIYFDMSNTNFTIQPLAPSDAQASASLVCPGDAVSLSATVGANQTVDWYVGGCGATLVGSGNPLVVNPSVSTTYYAAARDLSSDVASGGCASVDVQVYSAGDVNADGVLDDLDIDPFVSLLLDNPVAPVCAGDMDGDGDVDGDDIGLFVHALLP